MTVIFGGYRTVWVVALFDLPTETPKQRKAYARFRTSLLKDGFTMLQYSVYARHCASEEHADVHRQRVRSVLPAEGEVLLLRMTDKQFGRMEVFFGKEQKQPESPALQYELL